MCLTMHLCRNRTQTPKWSSGVSTQPRRHHLINLLHVDIACTEFQALVPVPAPQHEPETRSFSLAPRLPLLPAITSPNLPSNLSTFAPFSLPSPSITSTSPPKSYQSLNSSVSINLVSAKQPEGSLQTCQQCSPDENPQ